MGKQHAKQRKLFRKQQRKQLRRKRFVYKHEGAVQNSGKRKRRQFKLKLIEAVKLKFKLVKTVEFVKAAE